MDIAGGTNYQDFGTSQLLSVPYALHANNASTSDYSFSPTFPNGFQNITPITFELHESAPYTVPAGKILYILNIFLSSGSILVNGIALGSGSYGRHNPDKTGYLLNQPILVDEGEIVSFSGTYSGAFNGFLIDK